MTVHQTPDHYQLDAFGPGIDDKFSVHDPAQYAIVFNAKGEALLFTRKGLNVQHYRDAPETFHPAAFQDNPDLTLIDPSLQAVQIVNTLLISVLQTNEGTLVHSPVDKPGGIPPCRWHRIGGS